MHNKTATDASQLLVLSPPANQTDVHQKSRSYAFMRVFAIEVALLRFREALEIFEKHNYIEEFWLDREQLPENMFSWSFESCMTRLRNSTISYDLVLTVCKPLMLEKKKTMVDLKEIKKYVTTILNNYLNNGNNHDIVKSLKFYDAYLLYKEKLEDEKDENINIYTGEQLAFMRTKIESKKMEDPSRRTINDLRTEQTLMESMHIRYRSRFYASYADALEISRQQIEDRMTEELKHQLQTVNEAIYCFQSSLSMYFNEIETLKERITELTEQFSKEDELMGNKLSETKRKLEKIQAARIFYNDELARFRVETKLMMERDEYLRLKSMRTSRMKRSTRRHKSTASSLGRISNR